MPIIVHAGDSREVLRAIPDESVDAVVTDAPYGLSDDPDVVAVLKAWMAGEEYHHPGKGFMGHAWDSMVPGPPIWRECLRVLKPGGVLLAFFGARTEDLGSLAIRLAGFERKDMLAWLYGNGMPKVGYIKDAAGEPVREGWAGSLKPALEPIVMAIKPRRDTIPATMARYGTGALNIDGCRIETEDSMRGARNASSNAGTIYGAEAGGTYEQNAAGRWPATVIHDGSDEVIAAFPQTGRVDLRSEKSHPRSRAETASVYGADHRTDPTPTYGDIGSAARLFYSPKAGAGDRVYRCSACDARWMGSARPCGCRDVADPAKAASTISHPTVKRLDLMQWLVRLVTPPGGTVLDPFAGTGTTGAACLLEGLNAILIEREPEYVADIHFRLANTRLPERDLFAAE